MKYLLYYLIFINTFSFILMGIDKNKAKKQSFRISEKNLMLSAFVGGSAGALLGMKTFHHKTKHKLFTIGIPAILILHIVLAIYYYYNYYFK